jgi:N-acyl-D-amino-acid deacylase
MHDIIVVNGTVIDGSGTPRQQADVGIAGGIVTEVGTVRGPSRQIIDAPDRFVVPGFVDGHTTSTRSSCGIPWPSRPASTE